MKEHKLITSKCPYYRRTRNLPGGSAQLAGKADNLTTICVSGLSRTVVLNLRDRDRNPINSYIRQGPSPNKCQGQALGYRSSLVEGGCWASHFTCRCCRLCHWVEYRPVSGPYTGLAQVEKLN
jgi:hypothetical protein